jgi:hypothetical protein
MVLTLHRACSHAGDDLLRRNECEDDRQDRQQHARCHSDTLIDIIFCDRNCNRNCHSRRAPA